MNFKIPHNTTLINFMSSTLFMYGVTLITGFVTYRYVTPDYLGIWAIFSTFTTIATIIRLGIVNGMNRELPYCLGKGETEKAYGYASTTLCYSLFTSGLLFLVGIVFWVVYDFDGKGEYSYAYRFASIVFFIKIVAEPYANYLSGTFRTSDNFDKLSRIQYILGLVRLFTIPLVALFFYDGYLIRELIVVILNVVLLHFYRPLTKIVPFFKLSLFKSLFATGFTVFLVSYISVLVDAIPRLYIIKSGSAGDLGLYSPVLIILSTVLLIPNTLSNYLYPKFSFAYGQGCTREFLWKKMKLLLLGSVLIGLLCSLGISLLIDKLLLFFPKYIGASPYIKITAYGMVFLAYKVANVICVVLKEYRWIWVMPILNVIFQIVSILMIREYVCDNLMVVSYSFFTTFLLMFFTSWWVVYKVTHKKDSNNSKKTNS